MFPLNTVYGGKCVVMRKRAACPLPYAMDEDVQKKKGKSKKGPKEQELCFEESKVFGVPSGGYLIGRHPECGKFSQSR